MKIKLLNKVYYLIFIFVMILMIYSISKAPVSYSIGESSDNVPIFSLNLFYYTDFLLPIIFSPIIIYFFSIDYKYNVFPLLVAYSKSQINTSILKKLLAFIGVFTLIHLLLILLCCKGTVINIPYQSMTRNISFFDVWALSYPTGLLMIVLPAFLVSMFKNPIYVTVIYYGYIILEYLSLGAFTKKLCLFQNLKPDGYNLNNIFEPNIVLNRLCVLSLSIVLTAIMLQITSREK